MNNLFKKILPLLKVKTDAFLHIAQVSFEYPPEEAISGRLSIGGSAICIFGHADHNCISEGEGLVCLTTYPNRHRHCFHSDYYVSGNDSFRHSRSSGGFVPAITVCRQGAFMPLENKRQPPKS